MSLSNASKLFDANSVRGGEVCISSSISRGSLLQSVGAGKGGKAYSPMFEFSCVIVYLITIFFLQHTSLLFYNVVISPLPSYQSKQVMPLTQFFSGCIFKTELIFVSLWFQVRPTVKGALNRDKLNSTACTESKGVLIQNLELQN